MDLQWMCKDTIPVVFGIKEMHIDFCNALAWDAKEMKKQEGVMSTNLKQYSLINKSIAICKLCHMLKFLGFPPPPPQIQWIFDFFSKNS